MMGQYLARLAQRVLDALRKLDDGTYGTCESCGNPIARASTSPPPPGPVCTTSSTGFTGLNCANAGPVPAAATAANKTVDKLFLMEILLVD